MVSSDLITYKELMKLTGYSLQTLRQYKVKGILPKESFRLQNSPVWEYKDIQDFVKKSQDEK